MTNSSCQIYEYSLRLNFFHWVYLDTNWGENSSVSSLKPHFSAVTHGGYVTGK